MFAALLLFFGYSFTCALAAPLRRRAPGGRSKHEGHRKYIAFEGSGTHYDVAAGVGSCGETKSNDDLVVALNKDQMKNGPNPNTNYRCGLRVSVKGAKGSTYATVADTCPGCASGSIDMSPSLYSVVCGDLDLGVCDITWDFE
ncbi:hypothetical protein BD560DRAFT_494130 [Blakeslea trispora]|nr:hypothetical protein BD560DRAFT_494130 [Blakeslea trispora]